MGNEMWIYGIILFVAAVVLVALYAGGYLAAVNLGIGSWNVPLTQTFTKSSYIFGERADAKISIGTFSQHFSQYPTLQGQITYRLKDIKVDGVSVIDNPANAPAWSSWSYTQSPGTKAVSGYASCQYYCYSQGDAIPGADIISYSLRGLAVGQHTVTAVIVTGGPNFNTKYTCDSQGYNCGATERTITDTITVTATEAGGANLSGPGNETITPCFSITGGCPSTTPTGQGGGAAVAGGATAKGDWLSGLGKLFRDYFFCPVFGWC